MSAIKKKAELSLIEKYAEIGNQLKYLRLEYKIVLGFFYAQRLGDRDIAAALNYAMRQKNWTHEKVREIRIKLIKKLDRQFRQNGIIVKEAYEC